MGALRSFHSSTRQAPPHFNPLKASNQHHSLLRLTPIQMRRTQRERRALVGRQGYESSDSDGPPGARKGPGAKLRHPARPLPVFGVHLRSTRKAAGPSRTTERPNQKREGHFPPPPHMFNRSKYHHMMIVRRSRPLLGPTRLRSSNRIRG